MDNGKIEIIIRTVIPRKLSSTPEIEFFKCEYFTLYDQNDYYCCVCHFGVKAMGHFCKPLKEKTLYIEIRERVYTEISKMMKIKRFEGEPSLILSFKIIIHFREFTVPPLKIRNIKKKHICVPQFLLKRLH